MDVKRATTSASTTTFAPRLLGGLANANNRRVSTMWIGSSTTAGTGATTFLTRYTNLVGGMLQTNYNGGILGGYQVFPDDSGWTTVGTTTNIGRGMGLRSKTLSAGATMSRTLTNSTGFDFHYAQGPGQGSFTITIDGGAAQEIVPDTTGVYRHDGVWSSSNLTRGSHTVLITATNTFDFNILYSWDGDKNAGVRVYNSGTGASTAATFINSNAHTMWERAAILPNMAGVFIMIGANDWNQNVNPDTFESNLITLINNGKAALSTQVPDFILINTYKRYDTPSPTYPYERYGQVMAKLARTQARVYYQDIASFFPATNTSADDPEDMMGVDNTHMNQAGHYHMARLIGQNIISNG